jgi:hypothetical protein
MLQSNSVTKLQILDEPGIAEVRSSTTNNITSTVFSDVLTISITIPSSGFIVLEGKSIAWLGNVTGQNQIYMQIDETQGGGLQNTYWSKAGLGSYPSTDNSFFPICCQRTYSKAAGTYTFRLEAAAVNGNASGATTNLYQTQLRAIFYPTAYGTVNLEDDSIEGVDESTIK